MGFGTRREFAVSLSFLCPSYISSEGPPLAGSQGLHATRAPPGPRLFENQYLGSAQQLRPGSSCFLEQGLLVHEHEFHSKTGSARLLSKFECHC
ncbi:hypothetical protein HWI79_39 [Cryptosporidium felis]|nr:hypothetical protein HWI79_39 [Cryptosporidium felis]